MTWAERVRNLMEAVGWSLPEASSAFGFKLNLTGHHGNAYNPKHGVRRVLEGGMPDISFVRRLNELETLHAVDLQALRDGKIQIIRGEGGKRDKRIDLRPKPGRQFVPRVQRPADLAAVGEAVGGSHEAGGGQAAGVADGVRSVGENPVRQRIGGLGYREKRAGRPEGSAGGSAEAAGGICQKA